MKASKHASSGAAVVDYDAAGRPIITTIDSHTADALRQAGYNVRALGQWLWEARTELSTPRA